MRKRRLHINLVKASIDELFSKQIRKDEIQPK